MTASFIYHKDICFVQILCTVIGSFEDLEANIFEDLEANNPQIHQRLMRTFQPNSSHMRFRSRPLFYLRKEFYSRMNGLRLVTEIRQQLQMRHFNQTVVST